MTLFILSKCQILNQKKFKLTYFMRPENVVRRHVPGNIYIVEISRLILFGTKNSVD